MSFKIKLDKFKRIISIYAHQILIVIALTTAIMGFVEYTVMPVVETSIKNHLNLSLQLSEQAVKKHYSDFRILYNLLKNYGYPLDSEYITVVKSIIVENQGLKDLIIELKSINVLGGTQYIYVYTKVGEDILVFIIDAEMLYGDELWPGYRLVTSSSMFKDIIDIQKLEYVVNEDEFGKHMSALSPLTGYKDVIVGVDYDLHGPIYRKIKQIKYIIGIALFLLAFSITKLYNDNRK